MHRSRIHAVIIDVPSPEAGRAAAFWSAAFGVPTRTSPDEPQFISLPGAIPGIGTAVQAVDDAPRIHLDLETDDVEAEVARLVGLGAVRVAQWLEVQVLRAPGGHLMCVLPVDGDSERFEREASTWQYLELGVSRAGSQAQLSDPGQTTSVLGSAPVDRKRSTTACRHGSP